MMRRVDGRDTGSGWYVYGLSADDKARVALVVDCVTIRRWELVRLRQKLGEEGAAGA
jgi:hypothetical protein